MPDDNTTTVFQPNPNSRGRGGFKHGHSTKERLTPTYQSWKSIGRRLKPNFSDAHRYYDRGIKRCQGLSVFINFLACAGERPSIEYSIDRVNNDGNYSCGECAECIEKGWPMNLRWATNGEQRRNQCRNRNLTFQGRTMCLLDWATEIGISNHALLKRLRKWTTEEAMTTPKGERPPHLGHASSLAIRTQKGTVKLDEHDVRTIRDLVADGEPQWKVAERYQLNPAYVSLIVSRKKWKRVI